MDENQTLEIDVFGTALSAKMQRNKKRMADELIGDEGNSSDSFTDFQVNAFNLIMNRSHKNHALYNTTSCVKIYPAWIQQSLKGRLRGLAVACWTTDHYHPCSNLGVGISEGCFIFYFAPLLLKLARPI